MPAGEEGEAGGGGGHRQRQRQVIVRARAYESSTLGKGTRKRKGEEGNDSCGVLECPRMFLSRTWV